MWELKENLSLFSANDEIYPDKETIVKTKDFNFSQNGCDDEQCIDDFLLFITIKVQSYLLKNFD